MRKKEAIVYISKSVIDNWQVPFASDKRGVNAVYSDNVFAIIYHLIVRLNISQQAALQQLERRKLVEMEVWSQATRSKRISKIKKDRNKKNNRKGFKNLVISEEGYSFQRTITHDTESYNIYNFQGDSRPIIKNSKLPKAKAKAKAKTINQMIEEWLSTNEKDVFTLKSFLALDNVSTFNMLIPFFPNHTIPQKSKEKITDVFEKLNGIKDKHTLIPKPPENSAYSDVRSKQNDGIKAVLIHFPYQNTDIANNTKLNYLSAFWLTCHKTRLNYLLYFKEKKRLDSDNRYSISLRRTNKSLIVNVKQTKGTGRRVVETQLKATIKLPTITPEESTISIDKLEVNSKGYVIDVDVSNYDLTFPFEEYVGGIATGNVAQHLGKWFNWINRYANLEDELYSYYHQLPPSEVTKYNSMAEFKDNPFTVFKRNPFVLPLSLK